MVYIVKSFDVYTICLHGYWIYNFMMLISRLTQTPVITSLHVSFSNSLKRTRPAPLEETHIPLITTRDLPYYQGTSNTPKKPLCERSNKITLVISLSPP